MSQSDKVETLQTQKSPLGADNEKSPLGVGVNKDAGREAGAGKEVSREREVNRDASTPSLGPDINKPAGTSPLSPEQPAPSHTASVDVDPVDQEDARANKAAGIVKNHVIASMGISLVPIPLVDLVGLTGTQLKMLHSLAKLYRVPFSENLGKSLIVSLVGGVMPTSTALTLASFAKAIPGLGTATGMVSVTVLGGATTYAIGSVFVQHFESGGTLLDFDPKSMKEYFANKLQEGKNVASNLRKSNR